MSSFISAEQITAYLPSSITGFVPLRVASTSGQASISIFALPATSGSLAAIQSVTNAASGASGAIAPGEMVMIKGNGLGPTSGVSFSLDPSTNSVIDALAGTRVLFDGLAAPITYTSSDQVNAIVPYELAGESQVTMQVVFDGIATPAMTLSVAAAAPGVFTASGSGTGQALAANQNGSINGPANPATPGSYLTLYITGGGQTNPAGVTGSVTGSVLKYLIQPISVTVGGQPATVSFVGAAPTFVDGLGQLNIQLGAGTPPGQQPVVVTLAGISSPATATVAVQAPQLPTLQSLTLSQTSIPAGGSLTGTVTLSGVAPAGGVQVSLASDSANVKIPASVTVSPGENSASFTITTITVISPQTATITARAGTVAVTSTLSLSPITFSLQGMSFAINGTLSLGGKTVPFEIQAVGGGANQPYYISIDDGIAPNFPIQFIVQFSSQASNPAGKAIIFGGLATVGTYLDTTNPLNPVISSVSAASLIINFTSLANGSAVTGAVAFATPVGQINAAFNGTVMF